MANQMENDTEAGMFPKAYASPHKLFTGTYVSIHLLVVGRE